jgi:D-methionine transport system substrate-binding protein
MILALHGVIKLKDPDNVASAIADITDNPKKLRFVELDAAQLPRSLQDVDLVSINNNYAVQAGLNPATDAIARESADGPWINIIAVREAANRGLSLRSGEKLSRDALQRHLCLYVVTIS